YKHVRTIQIVEDGSVTPKASINPKEGIIYLNPDFFSNLPWLWKVYIIFHEIAHLWMHTEPETDLWASYLYVKAGYPPSQAAMCLKYTLSD
ncbi:MAG: hypothetical protein N3E49_09630, partial [Bacteroidia bacterium]|nr:hypothetical protein [Bacteroidia bacterium]